MRSERSQYSFDLLELDLTMEDLMGRPRPGMADHAGGLGAGAMTAGPLALRATWTAAAVTGRVSARVARPFVSHLWFTPWRVPVPETVRRREDSWLRDTRPLTLRTRAGDLAAFTAGEGPTVLLVHGWGERASAMGNLIAPLVAAGHRVVGMDLPGHGANPASRTDLPSAAASLRAASAHLGGVDAVVAHSLGGLATVVALRDGLNAGAVVLLAPAVRLDAALARFAVQMRLPSRAVAGLRHDIANRFGPAVWEDYRADRIAAGLTTAALIVHDEADPQVDLADVQALTESWPGARLHSTTGLGHRRLLRDPGVATAVTQFLTEALAQLPNRATST